MSNTECQVTKTSYPLEKNRVGYLVEDPAKDEVQIEEYLVPSTPYLLSNQSSLTIKQRHRRWVTDRRDVRNDENTDVCGSQEPGGV